MRSGGGKSIIGEGIWKRHVTNLEGRKAGIEEFGGRVNGGRKF